MPSLAITNSFVAHTTIRSAAMNQNFQDVQTWANNSIAGQTYTAWTDYTPTWSTTGSAPSIGNGTIAGRYCQIGKVVFYRVYLGWGSTTSSGSNTFKFSVPINRVSTSQPQEQGTAIADDTATALYTGVVAFPGGVQDYLTIRSHAAAGNWQSIAPFTWASGDSLNFTIFYEVT